jgi:hypothetical protein
MNETITLEKQIMARKEELNRRRESKSIEKPVVQEIIRPSHEERIVDLEVKMAKLWDLLTDRPKGRGKQQTISKFGLKFRDKFSRG